MSKRFRNHDIDRPPKRNNHSSILSLRICQAYLCDGAATESKKNKNRIMLGDMLS